MSATTTTAPNAQVGKVKASKDPVSWGTTIVLILCALTVILPLFVAVSMAFKTSAQAVDGQAFTLPSPFSISGFVEAWNLTNFPVGAGISFIVTAGTVVCTILLSAMASYAIVRNWDRKLFKYSFFYLMAVMFIPFSVVALPADPVDRYLALGQLLRRDLPGDDVPDGLLGHAVHRLPAVHPVGA